MAKLSTQSYKGARDWYPEDMQLRNYIFDTWRKVCRSYGFEEYDFPILEPWEIFAAKTGEEIVNQQLFSFEDKSGRKLAIRPELTPGTVRLLAQKYGELTKPVKWFMIGNNWRYEKPQKGRGREFFQLEANVFGTADVTADFEIFSLMIDIMKAFGANEKQFQISFSDRRLLSALLEIYLKLDVSTSTAVRRLMDKRAKMTETDFRSALKELGLPDDQSKIVEQFMQTNFDTIEKVLPSSLLEINQGYQNLLQLTQMLKNNKFDKYCRFDPSIIRGFDYSDGLVYEAFDMQPDNNRSMFGGERFDKLIKIFGDNYEMEATGFGMGDYTLIEFLKAWDLIPNFENQIKVLITVFSSEDLTFYSESWKLAQKLREAGVNCSVFSDLTKSLQKQFKYANRKKIPWVVTVGPNELAESKVSLKDMLTGEQKTVSVEELLAIVKS